MLSSVPRCAVCRSSTQCKHCPTLGVSVTVPSRDANIFREAERARGSPHCSRNPSWGRGQLWGTVGRCHLKGPGQHLNHENTVGSLFADPATLWLRKSLQVLFLVKHSEGAGCPILPAAAKEGMMLSAHPGFFSLFNLLLWWWENLCHKDGAHRLQTRRAGPELSSSNPFF